MDFPGRTLRAVCDISTGTLTITQRAPAYTHESGALAVEVDLRKNGAAYQPSAGVDAGMYLFWPGTPYMTELITMDISGSTVSGIFGDAMTARAGRPMIVIQLQDTGTGDIIVAAAEPIQITKVEGEMIVTTRPPTPSEIVYVGRSPYIDMETLHWMQWDAGNHRYIDTGVLSKGGGVETVNGISPDPSGNVEITKSDVGLGNVDNTSDADKPISTATQTALDGKVPTTRTVNGHALSENVEITKTDVGLGNVDNTSDANKPISTATQAALDSKVPTSRTVNGHELSENATLTGSDIPVSESDSTKVDAAISQINQQINDAPTESTAQDILAQEVLRTAYEQALWDNLDNLFSNLPSDTVANDIYLELHKGNEFLEMLYRECAERENA